MTCLIVTTRNVYGNEVIDPVNDAAKALAAIAGTKTLRFHDIQRAVASLGCTVELQSPNVTGAVFQAVRALAS